ncbi:MAG: hypothetical protein QF645_00710 [Planctomycetota bacterium]|nr:hypothetical protein [Planctomycetota bacterium]
MKKAIWIFIVTVVMGLILTSQRGKEQGRVAKAPQALVMNTSMEMDENAPSDEKSDFAPKKERDARLSPQWYEFRTLVSEIMQREDLSPQERQGLLGMLSPTSR